MTTIEHPASEAAWHSISPCDVAADLGVEPDQGLDAGEVEQRLSRYGSNELPQEPRPSLRQVAREQLANPMWS